MSHDKRISQSGLDLIKAFEGFRPRSEPLPQGGWIVGYGHTRAAREGVKVTQLEAEYLLRYDLQAFEELVSREVIAPLNQNEFDALVAFAWNLGKDAFLGSDTLRYVNAGQMLAAAESFSAWRKARVGGRLIVVDALVRRRTAEKNLFLNHPSGLSSTPSAVVRPECDRASSVLALSNGALTMESKMHAPDVANDQYSLDQECSKDRAVIARQAYSFYDEVEDDEIYEYGPAPKSNTPPMQSDTHRTNTAQVDGTDLWSAVTPTILFVKQSVAG